jgi:hypothetical protein
LEGVEVFGCRSSTSHAGKRETTAGLLPRKPQPELV